MNGNAVEADGTLVHCEHGRRCISRGGRLLSDEPEPIVTHYQGRRINSPNDVAVAPDGAIWFTDPTFGVIMPNQGALAEPELDHRSVYRFDPGDRRSATDGGLRRAQRPGVHGRRRRALCFGHFPFIGRGPTDLTRAASTRSSRSTLAKTGISPIVASSVIPIMAIRTGSPSMSAAGCGRRRPMACTSGPPDRRKLGFIPTPSVASNCAFGGAGRSAAVHRRHPISAGDRPQRVSWCEVPVGVAQQRLLVVRRHTIRVAATSLARSARARRRSRTPISEQLHMWRMFGRNHRHDVDLDVVEPIERDLGGPWLSDRSPCTKPMTAVEALARRNVGDADGAVVDPHHAFA